MSYSLMEKCGACQKSDKCADVHILRGAVYGIHLMGTERGHLGSGNIELTCWNFVEKEEKKA